MASRGSSWRRRCDERGLGHAGEPTPMLTLARSESGLLASGRLMLDCEALVSPSGSGPSRSGRSRALSGPRVEDVRRVLLVVRLGATRLDEVVLLLDARFRRRATIQVNLPASSPGADWIEQLAMARQQTPCAPVQPTTVAVSQRVLACRGWMRFTTSLTDPGRTALSCLRPNRRLERRTASQVDAADLPSEPIERAVVTGQPIWVQLTLPWLSDDQQAWFEGSVDPWQDLEEPELDWTDVQGVLDAVGIGPSALDPHERRLLDRLPFLYGRGVARVAREVWEPARTRLPTCASSPRSASARKPRTPLRASGPCVPPSA